MPPSIGAVVKELRQARNLSQRKLQKLSKGQVNASWLANLETDDIKNPPQAKLEVLAKYLGTTIAEIYQRAGIIDIPPDGISPEEKQLIEDYRALSPRDRARARRILRDLAEADVVEEQEQGQGGHGKDKNKKAA